MEVRVRSTRKPLLYPVTSFSRSMSTLSTSIVVERERKRHSTCYGHSPQQKRAPIFTFKEKEKASVSDGNHTKGWPMHKHIHASLFSAHTVMPLIPRKSRAFLSSRDTVMGRRRRRYRAISPSFLPEKLVGHVPSWLGRLHPPPSRPELEGGVVMGPGGGGVGTRPWWLALLACGGAYWPLAFEPSAMKSRHPYYCGHPHCRGHPPCWVGNPECNFCPWRPPLTA